VTGGAHDTLRDQLVDFLYDATTPRDEDALADALVPVVLQFADAQVAAERERIIADLTSLRDRVAIAYRSLVDEAIYIARGRP
jgi:hypothetical protein